MARFGRAFPIHPWISKRQPSGASTQTLTPSLYSDADTFYSATVGRGTVTLTPSLFTDADIFYAPTVTARYTLTPALFSDADTFYSATVGRGTVTLVPSLFTDADTFYSATVAARYTLTPSRYSDADTFYTPVVAGPLIPSLFVNVSVFYTPIVAAGVVGGSRGVSDTTDPIFYDWWRKKAEEQIKGKHKRREDEDDAAPVAVVASQPAPPKQPRKPRTLSAQTLIGIQEAEGLDDIRRLMIGLRGAEAGILRELVALYEREREDEEDVELLLLS